MGVGKLAALANASLCPLP